MTWKPAQLIVDPATQAAMPDLLTRLEADWLNDGYQSTRKVWLPGQTAADLYRYINSTNCVVVMLLGDVPIPYAGPCNPDGHSFRMIPTDVVLCGNGYFINVAGQFMASTPFNFIRRVMRVTYEGLSVPDKMAEYRAYLDRNHASRTGQFAYERRGYIIDHDAYKLAIGGQARTALTTMLGNDLTYGLPDHDPDSGTSDHKQYYLELEGHSWLLLTDFGGGYPTGIYYSGNSAAMELLPGQAFPTSPYRPVVAIKGLLASDIPNWDGPDAYLKAAMLSGLFAFSMTDTSVLALPDFSLMEAQGVPQMLYNYQHASLAYQAFGDPTMDRLPTQPASVTYTVQAGTVILPVIPPPATGDTFLSDQQIATINASVDAKIAAMHDALQADYTAKIAAAVATMQTSQGQTGSPTTTIPATGTSGAGTPTTGAGATVPLVINCGAADSAYAKSGLLWTNQPTATTPIDVSGVSSPYDASFYRSGRGGPIALLSAGGYTPGSTLPVRLDFSEPHWASAGQRRFDVTLNGVKVLAAFDIFAAAGGAMNKAVSRSFSVVVGADGAINISLVATAGSPDTNSYLCVAAIG